MTGAYALLWTALARSRPPRSRGADNALQSPTKRESVSKADEGERIAAIGMWESLAALRYLPLWACITQHMAFNGIKYTLSGWMPTYCTPRVLPPFARARSGSGAVHLPPPWLPPPACLHLPASTCLPPPAADAKRYGLSPADSAKYLGVAQVWPHPLQPAGVATRCGEPSHARAKPQLRRSRRVLRVHSSLACCRSSVGPGEAALLASSLPPTGPEPTSKVQPASSKRKPGGKRGAGCAVSSSSLLFSRRAFALVGFTLMGGCAFSLGVPHGVGSTASTTSVLLCGIAAGLSAHSFGFKVRARLARYRMMPTLHRVTLASPLPSHRPTIWT